MYVNMNYFKPKKICKYLFSFNTKTDETFDQVKILKMRRVCSVISIRKWKFKFYIS